MNTTCGGSVLCKPLVYLVPAESDFLAREPTKSESRATVWATMFPCWVSVSTCAGCNTSCCQRACTSGTYLYYDRCPAPLTTQLLMLVLQDRLMFLRYWQNSTGYCQGKLQRSGMRGKTAIGGSSKSKRTVCVMFTVASMV